MSSSSAIVGISKTKKRYRDQDELLSAFAHKPCSTAKEAAAYKGWHTDRIETYAKAQARAHDLQKLEYIERIDGRECRQTGKVANVYKITESGIAHLVKIGLLSRKPVEQSEPVKVVNREQGKRNFAGLKSLLNA